MHLSSKLTLVSAAAGYLLATVAAEPSLAVNQAVREDLLTKRTRTYQNSTVVDKNYIDKELFKGTLPLTLPNVTTGELSLDVNATVVCKTCYVKFTATAELVVPDSFNASSAIQSQAQAHTDEVQNITTQVVNDITASLTNHTTDTLAVDFPGLQMPTIDLDFALNLSSIPECQLVYTFDELDAFVELQTNITGKATYDINLYHSEVPLDIDIGDNLDLEVYVDVRLLLDVDGAVDRETGFHIKLADGLAMTVDFYGKNVSDIEFKNGTYEILSIAIQDTSKAGFNARLRVTATTYVKVSPVSDVQILGVNLPYSAGVGFSLITDIVDFAVQVQSNVDNCAMHAKEQFQYSIGAEAGVDLDIDGHTWNSPPLSVMQPVWGTLATQCAATTLSSTSTALDRRADASDASVTSTISTTFTYSAVGCRSAGLVNCPVSLQSTTVTMVESTSVTVVPFGSTAAWPVSTATTATPIAFGTNAKSISLFVSGTPSSFVPAATASGSGGSGNSSSSSGSGASSHHHGVSSENKRIAIGVAVGVGVPLLAVISALIFYYRKKVKNV